MRRQDYFDQHAREWDEMREGFFSDAVRDKALSAAGVQRGKLAADIGSGTGFVTEGLIREGVSVIAVDRSEAMLAEMKSRFAGVEALDCRVGDAEHLPIPERAVDYVLANMCLHHVDRPLEAIREMVRILRPGGKLVITDLDAHTFEFLRDEHQDRWLGFKREEIRQWLMQAGLKEIVVDGLGESCCAQSICDGENAQISIFVASGQK